MLYCKDNILLKYINLQGVSNIMREIGTTASKLTMTIFLARR